MASKTEPSQLEPYVRAGWQLIPLKRFDAVDVHKGKKRPRGKSPRDDDWTKRPYKNEDQVAHMRAGFNVGVRLRSSDLVVDVDPRNFPDGETLDTADNPFRRMCADTGLDPDQYPQVKTGSGGLHIYMRKPSDVSTRDSLEDYPGVEFKTLGRQVVSAGSLHPDTRRTYDWDFLGPELREAGDAPSKLINLIRRPQAMSGNQGGGEYDQHEIAAMLEPLDPEEFKDHTQWLSLMMACHHASGGDARSEFIEWSTRDPQYADEGCAIGRRWDSLSAKRQDQASVTYKTLLKTLTDRGLGDKIPRTPPEDDFDDDGPDFEAPQLEGGESLGPLERMNKKYWAVLDNGKFRVMYETFDPELERPFWIKMGVTDLGLFLANKRVQKGERTVPISDAWIQWAGRRTAQGVIFDPEKDHPGYLNLWTGWSVQPRRGSWGLLNDLLYEVLCDRDDQVYDYVMNWAAHMIQHPGSPAEVAICFQGEKGVGKGTFFRALLWLCGRHGLHITSPEHFTGRFNAHLRDLIYLFADEAINPYDKASESRLKGLITEPTLAIEAKGVDVRPAKNRIHVGMASNEDWVVPMGLDGERRFLMQRANNGRQKDKAFFDRLYGQLNSGGLEALLFDLLNRDLGEWTPRECIPATAAATDQKLRGMSPTAQWWFNCLTAGSLDMKPAGDNKDWTTGPVRIFKQDVRDAFDQWCRQNGVRPGASGRALDMMFAEEMRSLVPALNSKVQERVTDEHYHIKKLGNDRAWAYEFPDLASCRSAMDRLLGLRYDWPEYDSWLD